MLCERVSSTTVGALLGGLTVFRVPTFQRAFAWGDEAVTAFLDDVERCYLKQRDSLPEPHFFGSIVTGPGKSGGMVRPERLVLDGQQRLAMFVLFARAIASGYNAVGERPDEAAEVPGAVCRARAAQIGSRYLISEEPEFQKVRSVATLSLNRADDPYFKGLLRDEEIEPTIDSHHRLKAANNRIRTFLNSKIEAVKPYGPEKEVEVLHGFYRSFIRDWEVVHVEAGGARQANQVYRILNNRGVPVGACDLLRASSLEACEGRLEEAEFIELEEAWTVMTTMSAPHPDVALEMSCMARSGARPPNQTSADFDVSVFPELANAPQIPDGQARDLRRSILERRDDFVAIRDLVAGQIHAPFSDDLDAVALSLIKSVLSDLEQHWLIPIILASREMRSADRHRLLFDLYLFAFRYKVICDGPVGTFERRVQATIGLLNRDPRSFVHRHFEDTLRDLIEAHANEAAFLSGLDDLRYENDKKAIRFLLAVLEYTSYWFEDGARGRPTFRNPDRAIDISRITIEHIGAQRDADGEHALLPLIHTIGNLTLLSEGANIRAGNRPFDEKRPILAESELAMNRNLAAIPKWGAAEVVGRQEELIRRAVRVFCLNHAVQGQLENG